MRLDKKYKTIKDIAFEKMNIPKDFVKPTFYDTKTNKIIGAEEGSLTWWHERGHQKYGSMPETQQKDFSRQSMWKAAFFFTVMALFMDIIKWVALTFLFANMYYAIYEEVWCWVYAYKKKNKKKNNSNSSGLKELTNY